MEGSVVKDFISEQKMLSKEQMKEAFIYGVICTADVISLKKETKGTEFLEINKIVNGIYNGFFSGSGKYTINGNIITSLGGARNVMFDIPCFREVYNVSNMNEYNYSLSDIFNGKNLDEIKDIVEMAFEFRNVDPINFSDLEVRNAIKGYKAFYEQGKCLKYWPNEVTINKWYNDVINDKQDDFDSVMVSSTNPSLVRERNDDASLIMQHPVFSDYKLMIVADGVGSCLRGDLAASMFCEKMYDWFNKLNLDDFNGNFNKLLKDSITWADMEIANYNETLGYDNVTVASVVVVTPKDTYYCTVGDTRIYFEYGDELQRVERIENLHDKALKYNAYELGLIRDDGYDCERPEGYIGYGCDVFGTCMPIVYNIPSDSYTGILLISDGVYKEVGDNDLEVLFNKCLPEDIADCVVEQATYGYIKNSRYSDIISGKRKIGRDNITAVAYKKVFEYDKDKVKGY